MHISQLLFLIVCFVGFFFVALLCKIAAIRSFSMDKLNYMRESGSGMSTLAYFLSKDTVDLFNVLIKPIVYLSMFYSFSNPRSTFLENYIILLCLVYCVTGIGYVFAIVFQPAQAQLVIPGSIFTCFCAICVAFSADDAIFVLALNTVVCASSGCSHPGGKPR